MLSFEVIAQLIQNQGMIHFRPLLNHPALHSGKSLKFSSIEGKLFSVITNTFSELYIELIYLSICPYVYHFSFAARDSDHFK